MSRPSDIKRVFLQFCADRGVNPDTLREAAAIELLRAFQDEVGFDGRQKGSKEDKLIFKTTGMSGDGGWTIRVARQLYKHGRSNQLSLTWAYDGPSFLADVALDSEGGGSAAWAKGATDQVATIGVEGKSPASFEMGIDPI